MLPWYVTREAVARSLDVKLTARSTAQIDRAIEGACRDVEGDLLRRFYPTRATYTFPRPCGSSIFVELDLNMDIVALDSLTVDGVAQTAPADYRLMPIGGPPYHEIRFTTPLGASAYNERPIEAAGTWGHENRTEPAGALAAAVGTTTATTVDVTDSAAVGVGDLLTVGTERMLVTGKSMLTTGQAMQGALSASTTETGLAVTDGTAFAVDEVLLVDSERLLVVDIAGNTLVVKRAWDGTVLAGHAGATVFAARRLTVQRGATGTTAATHSQGAAVVRQAYHGLLVAYSAALAQSYALAELAGQTSAEAANIQTTLQAARSAARQALQRI